MLFSLFPKMDVNQFVERKRDHIRHALSEENQATGFSGLDRIHLAHDALPELDFDQVRIGSVCLGRPSPTPLMITGMTAGHDDAFALNRRLARACERRGWTMGVGSQRRELEDPRGEAVDRWVQIRKESPTLTLIANVGASQLLGTSVASVRALIDSIQAQALAVHLNPLQECLQPEGTPRFAGVRDAIARLSAALSVPVVVKETGCGFSPAALSKLAGSGLAALDISGLGGTHWGRIEGARAAGSDEIREVASRTFADWGESTVDSLLAAVRSLPATELWASGGVRSGLDAAKLIALGAAQVGFARPALEAALQGESALDRWMERIEFELRVALFCTGTGTPDDLRRREGAWTRSAN